MGDISSGMSSSIMQLYLKQVLEAFFHTQSSVRHFALNVIALTLNQGLIHPVQVRARRLAIDQLYEIYFNNIYLGCILSAIKQHFYSDPFVSMVCV